MRLAVEHERLAEGLLEALRHPQRVATVLGLLAEHHELVATEARHRVARAHRLGQTRPDRLQHPVARVVPEGVVDELEVVDVHEEHGAAGTSGIALREDVCQPVQ